MYQSNAVAMQDKSNHSLLLLHCHASQANISPNPSPSTPSISLTHASTFSSFSFGSSVIIIPNQVPPTLVPQVSTKKFVLARLCRIQISFHQHHQHHYSSHNDDTHFIGSCLLSGKR